MAGLTARLNSVLATMGFHREEAPLEEKRGAPVSARQSKKPKAVPTAVQARPRPPVKKPAVAASKRTLYASIGDDEGQTPMDEVTRLLRSLNVILTSQNGPISVPKNLSGLIAAYASSDRTVPLVLLFIDEKKFNSQGAKATLSSVHQKLNAWYSTQNKQESIQLRPYLTNEDSIRKIQSRFLSMVADRGANSGDESMRQAEIGALLLEAKKLNASDIHIEKRAEGGRIRFRVNGDLVTVKAIDEEDAEAMVNVLWNTIAKQQGSAFDPKRKGHKASATPTTVAGGRSHTFRLRLQTLPHEEITYDLIARILPNPEATRKLNLYDLNYHAQQYQLFDKAMRNQNGVTIFSGTTGSGKTTSSVACVQRYIELNTGPEGDCRIKVITIEDPVEIQIENATQISIVNEDEVAGQVDKFAAAIAWAMRSDPDFLMVSEIRTRESAMGIVKGVQTGHPTLTTVHAQSAFGIIQRCVNIGINPHDLTARGFLNLLCHQTLLQVVCPNCCIDLSNPSEYVDRLSPILSTNFSRMRSQLDDIGLDQSKVKLRNGEGCSECNHTGIGGRTPVAEVVDPLPELMQLCGNGKIYDAEKLWYENKHALSMMDHSLCKVEQGLCDPFALYNKYGDLVPTNWSTGL